MSPFGRYLAEEIALDHADGLISRREALRRLGLLGLELTAATSLLAACGGGEQASAPTTSPTPTATPPPSPQASPPGPALRTEAIRFAGEQGRQLQGAWAAARQPAGAVLVLHENRGLTDHIRPVAGRLAASGYSALAIDLLSAEGGTAAVGDQAAAMAALSQAPPERFLADMRSGVGELSRRVPGKKVGAIGFCFGGGMVWLLLTAEPRLSAAAPFYGPLPENASFTGSKAAVLAIYAEMDERVNASREAARQALQAAGLTHEVVTVPGVNHAFFNDTGPRYDAAAAAQTYRRVLDWFGRYLA